MSNNTMSRDKYAAHIENLLRTSRNTNIKDQFYFISQAQQFLSKKEFLQGNRKVAFNQVMEFAHALGGFALNQDNAENAVNATCAIGQLLIDNKARSVMEPREAEKITTILTSYYQAAAPVVILHEIDLNHEKSSLYNSEKLAKIATIYHGLVANKQNYTSPDPRIQVETVEDENCIVFKNNNLEVCFATYPNPHRPEKAAIYPYRKRRESITALPHDM